MEISALTLKLIFLLIPGALATIIFKMLTIRHKENSDFMFVIMSIMQGMFSYLILQILVFIYVLAYNLLSDNCRVLNFEAINTFKNISDSSSIPYLEIFAASIISIILGFVITYIDHHKLVIKIAKKLGVTNKYGDENLFSYFLNSPDTQWVYIRDIDKSLCYSGFVRSFSETNEFKEIHLEQVTVYNYPDSIELYEIERIYLCLPKDRLIIEQAKSIQDGEENSEPTNPQDNKAS